MKIKPLIVTVVILFSMHAAYAQFGVIKDLDEIGFIAGAGFSNVKGSDVFGESKTKQGYLAGINLNYNFINTKRLSFSLILLFERKGYKTENEMFYYIDPYKQQLILGKQTNDTDIWAITMPILWKYRLNEGPVKFYAGAGGYGSLIKKMENNFYSPDQGSFKSTRNNINDFDWGMSLTLSADYTINDKVILCAGVLSNFGFTSIINNSKASVATTSLYISFRIIKAGRTFEH